MAGVAEISVIDQPEFGIVATLGNFLRPLAHDDQGDQSMLMNGAAQHRKPLIRLEGRVEVRLGQLAQLAKFETEEDIAFAVATGCDLEVLNKRASVLRAGSSLHSSYKVVHDPPPCHLALTFQSRNCQPRTSCRRCAPYLELAAHG